MKRISMLVVLASSMMLAAVASAQGMGRGHHGGCNQGPGHGLGPGGGFGQGMGFLVQLDLTEAQWKKVDELREEMEDELNSIYFEMDKVRQEVHELWLSPTPDQKKISAVMKKADPLRDKIRAAHIEFRIQVIALLTPEQNAERIEMTNRFERQRKHGRGLGGPPKDGDFDR